jgi:CBS domain-containing protein
MNVSEVMTHGVYITSPDETIRDAAQIMADLNTGVLPIGESDRLTGMLTDRDITTRVVAEARDVTTTLVRGCKGSRRQNVTLAGAPVAGPEP